MDFDATNQLLIIHTAFVIYLKKKKKKEHNGAVHQLFIDFQKAYDSVSREVVYNILTEFGILMKLIRPIKMCLNEMYSGVRVGKDFSDMFPIKNLEVCHLRCVEQMAIMGC